MGMFKKRNKFDTETISLTAMIDIMFLLLIYLVLTHKTLLEDAFLGVSLPAPASSRQEKASQLFAIDVKNINGVSGEDTYHINGKPWTYKEISTSLAELGKQNPETTIIINCDPNIKHYKLIKLLDICKHAGLNNLNILTDKNVKFIPD